MKRIIFILPVIIYCHAVYAQQKDFEGIVVYNVNVTSKVEGINALAWKNFLLLGDSLTIMYKGANARATTGLTTYYYRPDKQKVYIKFKDIDTLFYLDYHSENPEVKSTKNTDQKKIIGYDCKSLTFVVGTAKKKYFYAPELYRNPVYDAAYKIGGGDVLAKEMSAIWLEGVEDYPYFKIQQTSYSVQSSIVDDNVFVLPSLPEKVFSMTSILKNAEFSGKDKGWTRYIQNSMNAQLGAKYVKIPKGESSTSQTVIVDFIISEQGKPVNIIVLNKDEVHSKLAADAVSVIAASPMWKPATIFGAKTILHFQQSFIYQVVK